MYTAPTADEIAVKYKYTLWRRFQNLTRAQQRLAVITLCKHLGISDRTFESWLYYRKDDNKTIPADQLYQLATFFGCPVQAMWTESPKSLHLEYIKVINEANKI